jgi:succinoglycan biosynthesis transport protein ExoP
MDFAYLLKIILKRKWAIIGASLLASIVALLLTLHESKLYKSSTQISTGYASGEEVRITDATASSLEQMETKFNDAVVNMTSPTVVSMMTYKLILHDLQSGRPYKALSAQQMNSDEYKSIDKQAAINLFQDKWDHLTPLTSFLPEEKKLLKFLELYGYDYKTICKTLEVNRVQNTDYIGIDYKSINPELSAFVVNEIYDEFLRYYTANRSQNIGTAIDTLRVLMDKKKQILDNKNDSLRSLGLVDLPLTSSGTMDQLGIMNTKLEDDKDRVNRNKYTLQAINNRLTTMGSSSTSGATITGAQATPDIDELQEARRQMNEAYASYQAGGFTDQTLLARYNQLRSRYNVLAAQRPAEAAGTASAPGATINTLSREELVGRMSDLEVEQQADNDEINNLQIKIASLQGNLYATTSKSAVAQSALKDADQANKDYLAAKQRYYDAMDISSSSISNFRQIQPGQPAIEPEPSKRLLIIGGAGMSTFIIFILVLAFLAYLDTSVKTPAVFSKVINLKLISMVNLMNLKNKQLSALIAKPSDQYDDPIEKKRDNLFRESLRKLRYEIEISGKKIFLFTSTQKGEGKTTLIQALSYSMSLSKKKILIIDTNFCNNDLTVQMNLSPTLEKIDTTTIRSSEMESSLSAMATEVVKDSVYAIGCEGGDYTPSEILPRQNLLKQLRTLITMYDYIFLEGPPLNDFSDSKELVEFVDGVIAVFSAQRVIKQIDQESIRFFRSMNGKFCGSVLNMVEMENIKQK